MWRLWSRKRINADFYKSLYLIYDDSVTISNVRVQFFFRFGDSNLGTLQVIVSKVMERVGQTEKKRRKEVVSSASELLNDQESPETADINAMYVLLREKNGRTFHRK